jgi:hypothetical protein
MKTANHLVHIHQHYNISHEQIFKTVRVLIMALLLGYIAQLIFGAKSAGLL